VKNKHKLTNHLMIDCETLSLESNAVIATIGAVVFKLDGEVEILDSFYSRLTLNDQTMNGRHISANTFIWWLQQSDEAKNEIYNPLLERLDAYHALVSLQDFCIEHSIETIWANGNMADCIWLRSIFKDFDLKYPVTFRNDLDFRTAKVLTETKRPNYKFKWPKSGVKHNALDDAKNQAICLMHMFKDVILK